MNVVDIIFLLILALGIISGYRQGFVSQIVSIIGLVLGYVIARELYLKVSDQFVSQYIENTDISSVVSFFAIWLIIIILTGVFGTILSGILDKISLGWLNRFIGSLIGALKYIFLLSLVVGILDTFDTDSQIISETNKSESLLYSPTKRIGEQAFGFIKLKSIDLRKEIDDIDFKL